MRHKTFVISLVLPIAFAVSGLAVQAREVRRTVPLNADGQLSIDTHNGTVTVTTWDRPSVDINARIVPEIGTTDEDVARTEIRISGSGSSVHVETIYDALFLHWFGIGVSSPPVEYTISMPATARLEIDSHNSAVHVRGLRGDLRIEDHNGPIDVADQGGAVTIESHNGDVAVAFNRFAKPSRIETHNGSVVVHLPAQSAFELDADGQRLSFDSDFAVGTHSVDRDEIAGTVNGGGPKLRLSTHHGSIRLKKQ
jgi:putative adhesin